MESRHSQLGKVKNGDVTKEKIAILIGKQA
jgi:hypothetical protein